MSFQMIILTGSSLVGLLAIGVYRFIAYKNLRSFIFQLIALGIIAGLLYKFFYVSGSVVAKGDGASIYFVIILYGFMLLGMLANYAYAHLSLPMKERKEKEFDWGLFIAPVLASPIVFIPLLAAFQEIDPNIPLKHRIMVFLVAFQNGFFWKEYFDNKRKEKEKGDNMVKDVKGQ